MLEFRVLGPIEVVRDGGSLDLGRRRERLLVGALVLSANRVMSADRLVTDLWGPEPPPTAASSLRVHVSRLRRVVSGEEGDVLATRTGGYVLEVGPDAVDVACFERLVAAAQSAAAAGASRRAAGGFRAALELWRGPALGELAELPFAAAEAARLEEARLTALEERIEADLACGSHRGLTGELEALTAGHPLRERLWELRMLALYRSGRQADALAAYRELRRSLDVDLGLAPSAGVRLLEGGSCARTPASTRRRRPTGPGRRVVGPRRPRRPARAW